MGNSAGQRATELREAHRERVARNEVRVSSLWARPRRAYNVHIELDARAKASLEKTQLASNAQNQACWHVLEGPST